MSQEEERQIPRDLWEIESVGEECSQTHPAKTSGAAKTLSFKVRALGPDESELEPQFWHLFQWPCADQAAGH